MTNDGHLTVKNIAFDVGRLTMTKGWELSNINRMAYASDTTKSRDNTNSLLDPFAQIFTQRRDGQAQSMLLIV